MGIFGLGLLTSNKTFKCAKCGKKIKAGEQYSKNGKKYCCSRCCKLKKTAKKKAKTCEFC